MGLVVPSRRYREGGFERSELCCSFRGSPFTTIRPTTESHLASNVMMFQRCIFQRTSTQFITPDSRITSLAQGHGLYDSTKSKTSAVVGATPSAAFSSDHYHRSRLFRAVDPTESGDVAVLVLAAHVPVAAAAAPFVLRSASIDGDLALAAALDLVLKAQLAEVSCACIPVPPLDAIVSM